MDNDNPIFRSLALIEEKIHEKLTVENLADSIHFSKYHYQRVFREAVGESVMQYVTRRRLSLAARELAGGNSSVLEIALKYGYDSHEGFTRSFRAYTGVTPAEYRKYCHALNITERNAWKAECPYPRTKPSLSLRKEKCAMLYSNAANEIIRELNALVVQAKETAAYTEKQASQQGNAAYQKFWDFIISRTNAMADDLSGTLDRILSISQHPDEISARFMIVKTIDDAVFWCSLTAFQTGLTVSRAKPKDREAFQPICDRYDKLAADARIRAGKIVTFFNELSELIFRDIRENARQRIQEAVRKGKEISAVLNTGLGQPYLYIVQEIAAVTDELSSVPLEEITVCLLEDCLFRLEIIDFAAAVDFLRDPHPETLPSGIHEWKEQLQETAEFFQGLSADIRQTVFSPDKTAILENTQETRYRNMAFQSNILLFYLKGEREKLDSARLLGEEQKAAFDAIAAAFDRLIELAYRAAGEEDAGRLQKQLPALYAEMTAQAKALGECGGPIQYIAEEVKALEQAVFSVS